MLPHELYGFVYAKQCIDLVQSSKQLEEDHRKIRELGGVCPSRSERGSQRWEHDCDAFSLQIELLKRTGMKQLHFVSSMKTTETQCRSLYRGSA